MNKKIIVANWRMNPPKLKDAVILAQKIEKGLEENKNSIIVCPPSAFISDVQKTFKLGKVNIKLGAQDCFYEPKGSYSGMISPSMLSSLGVKYVIVGGTERRTLGDTSEIINKKIKAILKNGMGVIFSVGEEERDTAGMYLRSVEECLRNGLRGIDKKLLKNLIVAYEPAWAIGKGVTKSCNPDQIREMVLFIRKVLAEITSRKIGLTVPILYGGSVDIKNTKEIISLSDVDGVLVGRASLDPIRFTKIIGIISSL